MVEHASAMQQVAGSIPVQVCWLLSVIRVGPYKRVTGSQSSNIHCKCCYFIGRLSGEVAFHCNPRHKGACNPISSKDSVSGAQISASAMVCVGAARNPWTRQDVGVELSTGVGNSTNPRFRVNEVKNRQENANFYPHILGTWGLDLPIPVELLA